MRSKRVAILAVGLLVALLAWANLRTNRPPAKPDNPSAIPEASVPPVSAAPQKPRFPLASDSPRPARPPKLSGSEADAAMIELDKVNLMLRDYRTLTGGNPVGSNADIMAATMGDNPKHAKLGPPEGLQLNDKGELLDRWGTPYFFHQLSRSHMEIRSAGPDKIMWTEDDPVIR